MSNDKIKYHVGIGDLAIQMMVSDDGFGIPPVYSDEVHRIPNIVKLGIKGGGEPKDKWASNQLFRRVNRNTSVDLSLDHVGLPIALYDEIQGIVAVKGVSFGDTNPFEYPYFALGFWAPLSDDDYAFRWYPKVQIKPIEEEYETDTDESEIKDVKLEMTAVGLRYNNTLQSTYNSAREGADGITLEQFSKSVIYEEKQLTSLPS